MRNLVRLSCVLGFAVQIYYILLCAGASGLSDSSSHRVGLSILILVASPLFYFGYCLWSTFGDLRGRPLFVSGIVAHLCILPSLVLLVSGGVFVFGLPMLLTAFCWFIMYREVSVEYGKK